ncbi:hypothetical protein JCM3774_006482 [Rhodotorula dairenensis]
MFSAGGGNGAGAVAGQPNRVAQDAGHAQFAGRQPVHPHETAPAGSYSSQAEYDYRGGSVYAPYGHADYAGRVASSSATPFDHSSYAVAPQAGPSSRPRDPSGGYADYAAPTSAAPGGQGSHAWPRGAPGPSPKIVQTTLSRRDPNALATGSSYPSGNTAYLDPRTGQARTPEQQQHSTYSDYPDPRQPPTWMQAAGDQPPYAADSRTVAAMSALRPAEGPPRVAAVSYNSLGYPGGPRQQPSAPRQRYSTIEEETYTVPRRDLPHPPAPVHVSKQDAARADYTRQSFHTYLFDYLRRAGFTSAASALLAEAGPIENRDPRTGRPLYPTGATIGAFSDPRASAEAAQPAPHGAHENGGQAHAAEPPPFSPRFSGRGASGSADDGTTPTSAATPSHFGFNGEPRRGSESGSWGTPSSRSSYLSSQAPPRDSAATSGFSGSTVRDEPDRGFLYDWFSVFWDVYSAQARSSTPATGGKSFVHASSAAVEIAMRQQQVESNAARFGAALRAPPVRSIAPTPRTASHMVDPSMRPPIPLRRGSMQRVSDAVQGPSAALQQRAQQAARAAADQAMHARQQAERRDSLADEVVPANGTTYGGRRPSRTYAGPLTTTSTPHAGQRDESVTPTSQAESPARQVNGAPARHDTGSANRPAFSPEALQYNPEQLQHTAEAYQRYRASLVAKQSSQLELAKRQLSALGGNADDTRKHEEVGRPAAMAPAQPTDSAENAMPPPTRSLSRQASANGTPVTQSRVLLSVSAEAGQPDPRAESAMMAGKRRRTPETASEGNSNKRPNDGRRGSSGSEGGATSTPTDSRNEPLQPPSASAHKQVAVDSRATSASGGGAQDGRASTMPDVVSNGQGDLPAQDLTLEELNALLSSAPDQGHSQVAPDKSLDSAMDGAAFDYDEFLTSFGGQSALSSYDPTASF